MNTRRARTVALVFLLLGTSLAAFKLSHAHSPSEAVIFHSLGLINGFFAGVIIVLALLRNRGS